jgi:hypothetical protein
MPEPSDPLSERLATAPGLPTLLAEARATWLARAERDVAATAVECDEDAAASDPPAVHDGRPAGTPTSRRPERDAATSGGPSVRVRPSTPRWRAFEDAFPTFYQFTNRPRG